MCFGRKSICIRAHRELKLGNVCEREKIATDTAQEKVKGVILHFNERTLLSVQITCISLPFNTLVTTMNIQLKLKANVHMAV